VTAEEALQMRDGKSRVNLWVNKDSAHKNGSRRGSNDSTHGSRISSDALNGRRGSNDAVPSGNRRGSNSATTISKRYHARMDAGVLSDEDDTDDHGNSTHSCSSQESNIG
jgi:hypothetical protein